MKEQFDKRLVEKVKDSFDNHEESFDPKAWENFSEAYFKPKKEATKFTWVFWAASRKKSDLVTRVFLKKRMEVKIRQMFLIWQELTCLRSGI
jgi:hypothetical protein